MRLWSLHPKYLDARGLVALEARDPRWCTRWIAVDRPLAHPLFRVRSGGVAAWERTR